MSLTYTMSCPAFPQSLKTITQPRTHEWVREQHRCWVPAGCPVLHRHSALRLFSPWAEAVTMASCVRGCDRHCSQQGLRDYRDKNKNGISFVRHRDTVGSTTWPGRGDCDQPTDTQRSGLSLAFRSDTEPNHCLTRTFHHSSTHVHSHSCTDTRACAWIAKPEKW